MGSMCCTSAPRETKLIDKVDYLLGAYYSMMGRDDYIDSRLKKGKFYIFCHHPHNTHRLNDQYVIDELKKHPDKCGLRLFDDNFPTNHNITNEEERNREMQRILSCFVGSDIDLKQSTSLSWHNMLQLVSLEFDEKVVKKLRMVF
eukprot:74918_1